MKPQESDFFAAPGLVSVRAFGVDLYVKAHPLRLCDILTNSIYSHVFSGQAALRGDLLSVAKAAKVSFFRRHLLPTSSLVELSAGIAELTLPPEKPEPKKRKRKNSQPSNGGWQTEIEFISNESAEARQINQLPGYELLLSIYGWTPKTLMGMTPRQLWAVSETLADRIKKEAKHG